MTPGDFPWAVEQKRRRRRKAAEGLRVRLRRIPGLTSKDVLRRPLHLPCVIGPEFTQVKTKAHSEWQTVSAGEYSQPIGGKGAPTLDDLSFDSLSLTWDAEWLTNPETGPVEMKRNLERVQESGDPFHLAVFLHPYGRGAEVRGLYTLRSIERRLPRGEPDTRYYTLQFKEFRRAGQVRRTSRRAERLPVRHKVQKGDTLRSLANRYYGDGSLWRVIQSVNGIGQWGPEDDLTKIPRFAKKDAKITIPKIEVDSGGVGPDFPGDHDASAPTSAISAAEEL